MEEARTMLEEDQEQEQRDTFAITDDKSAEWAIKKIKEAEREQNRLLALIDEERADLDDQHEQEEQEQPVLRPPGDHHRVGVVGGGVP